MARIPTQKAYETSRKMEDELRSVAIRSATHSVTNLGVVTSDGGMVVASIFNRRNKSESLVGVTPSGQIWRDGRLVPSLAAALRS